MRREATIKVLPGNSGLPERHYRTTGVPDFPGDPGAEEWAEDRVYRVLCSKCGLIDKAATPTEGETRGDAHLRKHHRRPQPATRGEDDAETHKG